MIKPEPPEDLVTNSPMVFAIDQEDGDTSNLLPTGF